MAATILPLSMPTTTSTSSFSFSYLKRRRAARSASKPTTASLITSRPYINPQFASLIFSTLPAEIRLQIFKYALVGYPDPSRPYSRHSYWYRPGYTHARQITTALLFTCRRIYLETEILPLSLNEHIIWGVERSRIPPWSTNANYLLKPKGGGLKIAQMNHIQSVHIFAQQFWLEDWKDKWLAYSKNWPEGHPPKLKVTIRHTDWWYNLLGENSPLALDPKRKGRAKAGQWVGEEEPYETGSWGQRFEYMRGLKIFELELETVHAKASELEAIGDKAPTWRFPLGNGGEEEEVLVLDQEATQWTTWTGSKHFKGLNAPRQEPGLQLRQGSVASTASFAALRRQQRVGSCSSHESEKALAPEDALIYAVVKFTWRARSKHELMKNPAESKNDRSDTERQLQRDVTNGGGGDGAPVVAAGSLHVPRASYHRKNAAPTYYG